MACSSFLSLKSLFLFFGLCFTRPSSNNFIDDVCALARDHHLCIQTLRSDPKAPSFDFKGLGQISIGIAQDYAKQTSYLIAHLSSGTPDPKGRERYNTCAGAYADAIDNLIQTRNALNLGDIDTYRTKAAAALNGADNCEYTWQGPPEEVLELKQANAKAEGLISIVVAVGAKLS